MKKKFIGKKISVIVLTLVIVLSMTMRVDAAGTKLSKSKMTVCTGKSYTIKAYDVIENVKWTTSNKNVVSIKTSGRLKEKCKITAKGKGNATVIAKVKKGKKTEIYKCKVKVSGHKYGTVSYKWSKDNSKCTASKSCSRCGKTLKQSVKTSAKITQNATSTKKGKKTYTAKFTKYGFGKKTKSVSYKAKDNSNQQSKNENIKKFMKKWSGSYYYFTAGGTLYDIAFYGENVNNWVYGYPNNGIYLDDACGKIMKCDKNSITLKNVSNTKNICCRVGETITLKFTEKNGTRRLNGCEEGGYVIVNGKEEIPSKEEIRRWCNY